MTGKRRRREEAGRRPATGMRRATVAVMGLVVLTAACGGPNGPQSVHSSSGAMVQALAYARCMRSHHVSDFPDPTPIPGGGVGFQISAGPGSDLNHDNPKFEAADQACRSLLPGGEQPPAPPPQTLAAEVRWANCMRSHGLPGFPDPDAQGAFDSSRFDHSSPAFQTASKACKAVEPTGGISAVPGRGPQ
jgi:hypothetical protein